MAERGSDHQRPVAVNVDVVGALLRRCDVVRTDEHGLAHAQTVYSRRYEGVVGRHRHAKVNQRMLHRIDGKLCWKRQALMAGNGLLMRRAHRRSTASLRVVRTASNTP